MYVYVYIYIYTHTNTNLDFRPGQVQQARQEAARVTRAAGDAVDGIETLSVPDLP